MPCVTGPAVFARAILRLVSGTHMPWRDRLPPGVCAQVPVPELAKLVHEAVHHSVRLCLRSAMRGEGNASETAGRDGRCYPLGLSGGGATQVSLLTATAPPTRGIRRRGLRAHVSFCSALRIAGTLPTCNEKPPTGLTPSRFVGPVPSPCLAACWCLAAAARRVVRFQRCPDTRQPASQRAGGAGGRTLHRFQDLHHFHRQHRGAPARAHAG